MTAAEGNRRSLPSTLTLFSHLCRFCGAKSGCSNRSHVCAFPVAIPAAPGRGGACCLLETSPGLSLRAKAESLSSCCCCGMEQEMCRAGGRGGLPPVWPARVSCGHSATAGERLKGQGAGFGIQLPSLLVWKALTVYRKDSGAK